MSEGTEARGVARYRALFAHPHAVALVSWGIVARLPLGMAGLALVLLVRDTGAGYGEAGLVAAGYAAAVAVGAPYGGRILDRRGPATVLRRRLVLYPCLLVAVGVLAVEGAPVVAIAVMAAVAGLVVPPVGSALRTIWPRVVGPDAASTAYAIDASLQELIFVGGPVLVASLTAIDPVAGVFGAAGACAVGTFAFSRLPPVRETGPAETLHGSRFGALSAVGVRTLALLSLWLGLGFGAVEIAAPAFAELEGNRALAGIALAGFAAGSLCGGLAAGLRASRDEGRRIMAGTAVLAAMLALPLAANSIGTLTLLMFVAGIPIAPVVAAIFGLIGKVAAAGSVAEAFAWFGTSVSIGIAGGSVAGGWLIDQHGWRASVLLGVGCIAVGCVLTTLRRASLRPPPTSGPDPTG